MRSIKVLSCLLLTMFASNSINAAAESRLTGKWRVDTIKSVNAFDASKTELAFADGKVGTTVGCNRIAGKPRIVGDEIVFGPLAVTKMSCPDPLSEVETKYLAALGSTRYFRIDSQRLKFLDSAGVELIVFTRVD